MSILDFSVYGAGKAIFDKFRGRKFIIIYISIIKNHNYLLFSLFQIYNSYIVCQVCLEVSNFFDGVSIKKCLEHKIQLTVKSS